MSEYEKIIKEKGLPSVGQTVRSKKYGTLWRIMEKRRFGAISMPTPKAVISAWCLAFT